MASAGRNRERTYHGGRSYAIPVWSGIFEHHARIREALWEFLWCVDKVTKEFSGVGRVLNGAPVKIERIAKDMDGSDPETVRRHLKKLEAGGYIRMRRTPYGQVIEVLNSMKFGIWKKKERGHSVSLDQEKLQNAVSPDEEKHTRVDKKHTRVDERLQNAVSKEDSAVDSAVDTAAADDDENRHPPVRQNRTSDDAVEPPRQDQYDLKGRSAARVRIIKTEARSILEKRGHDSTFVIRAIELIHSRARTLPATAQYYVSAFDREGPDRMGIMLNIAFVQDVVETAGRTGRRATEVLRDRLSLNSGTHDAPTPKHLANNETESGHRSGSRKTSVGYARRPRRHSRSTESEAEPQSPLLDSVTKLERNGSKFNVRGSGKTRSYITAQGIKPGWQKARPL